MTMPEIWAAEENSLQTYLEKIENATDEQREKALSLFGGNAGSTIYSIDGDTAKIEIVGVLRKSVPPIARLLGFGGTSYADVLDAAEAIKADGAVKTVRVIFDSPGGAVDGLDEAYQAMADLAKCKEVIAEVRGMLCSAAYYLAAPSTRIVSSAPSNLIGSIGVVVAYTSFKGLDERLGIKEVVIRSSNAPKKNLDPETKDGQEVLQGRVDALERIFFNRISEGRNISVDQIAERFGRGDVFVSQDPDPDKPDAITTGMIDAVSLYKNVTLENNPEEKAMLKKEQIESCVAVLSGEYPRQLKDLAGKALSGEAEYSSLEIAKANFDVTSKPDVDKQVQEEIGAEEDLQASILAGRQRLGLGKAGA